MSGGRFDYIDGRLKGEIFGWTDEQALTTPVRKRKCADMREVTHD